MREYDHKKIEKHWQNIWEKKKTYKTLNTTKKRKYYVLDMFPYPSGVGLHVGHPKGYIGSDVFARMKRMQGYNVLHPMGYDAFGLPAEQYAIEHNINPKQAVEKNVKTFERQLSVIGLSYDWERRVNTTDPEFYKWTQWIFLKIYDSWYNLDTNKAEPIKKLIKTFPAKEWKKKTEKERQDILMKYRLAYEGYSEVNWCPKLGTVLANDEILEKDGKLVSERGGYPVVKKNMRQWFMRITAYAERLLLGLEGLDWSTHIKEIQKNWIGKSEGAEIEFKIKCDPSPALPKGKGEIPGYFTTDVENFKILQERAVEMRKNPTEAEKKLWKELKGDKNEYHFRQQHIINKFIVDFACLSKNLIIEIDGDIHDLQKEKDTERSDILKTLGFEIIRFSNKEVLENTASVVRRIINKLQNTNEFKALPLGEGWGGVELKVFTTRPDTIFGATYLVLAPEHELIQKFKTQIQNWSEVEKYILSLKNKTEEERTKNEKEKTGIELKGIKATNPANTQALPVWIADYVLPNYGTGAIMAVPAHDERDFEFASKFNLSIKVVIRPRPIDVGNINYDFYGPYTREGFLFNSGKFDGMDSEKAKKEITKFVGGKIVTNYKMRDAIFARQRYWGEPIPLIHKKDGTIEELKEKDLPLKLPPVKSYQPTGTGESPLAGVKDWVKHGYETNTMPGWAGSSWYFLRYMDPKNKKFFAGKDAIKYWRDVDMYVGGQEHATGHLLYSRFWHKVLKDYNLVPTEEPFQTLRNQGMILAADNRKMSKRWGNVINPDDIVKTYGADTLRVYEMFMGPFGQSVAWSTESIIGPRRFIERVWNLQYKVKKNTPPQPSPKGREEFKVSPFGGDLEGVNYESQLIEKTVKKVTEDIEEMKFNTAVSTLMIFVNEISKLEFISQIAYEKFLKILAPFAPHVTEEIWQKLVPQGRTLGSLKVRPSPASIHLSDWPKWNPDLIQDEKIKIAVQINGKVRAEIMIISDEDEEMVKDKAFANENVLKYVVEKASVKRIIYIKNKLINIVT